MKRILLLPVFFFAWALLTRPDPVPQTRSHRTSVIPAPPQEVASTTPARLSSMPRANASPDGDSLRLDWPGGVEWSPGAVELRSGGARSSPRVDSIDQQSGVVTLKRSGIEERYLFLEDGRVEQIFVVHEKPASGALSVHTSIQTNLTGPVLPIRRREPGWRDIEMMKGGLWFTDAAGRPALAYYGAVAIDAAGRRLEFEPEWQDGQIVLAVPEAFVTKASFPLTIDPFIELGGSATNGGISANALSSRFPSLRLASGNPVVAWQDDAAGFPFFPEIYLKRWNGSSWEALAGSATGGGVSATDGASLYPSLAVNSSGNPFVAWEDDTGGDIEIYLKYWDGDSWEELAGSASPPVTPIIPPVLGGVSAAAGGSFSPSVAVNSSGNPFVAWSQDVGGNFEIYLKYWDGDSWEELSGSATGGGISANAGFSASPSLALNASGNPVVAWEDTTGGNSEIYVKYWDGDSWEELSGSASGGGISANGGISILPSLALDASGNPAVAWDDDTDGDNEIYLKRWTGTSWVELSSSASGGGVSSNTGFSSEPSLAVDGSGNPVVAWFDDTGGNSEIYLKRWTGSAWEELENSATAGGISANPGFSTIPSLALNASGNPVVAWEDDTFGNLEIYAKVYQAPSTGLASIASLDQFVSNGGKIHQGQTAEQCDYNDLKVYLEVRLVDDVSEAYRCEIQYARVGSSYRSKWAKSVDLSPGDTQAEVSDLFTEGQWRWRARLVRVSDGAATSWVHFGSSDEEEIDFIIRIVVTDDDDGDGIADACDPDFNGTATCGLTGFEPVAALILLGLFGRRKRR